MEEYQSLLVELSSGVFFAHLYRLETMTQKISDSRLMHDRIFTLGGTIIVNRTVIVGTMILQRRTRGSDGGEMGLAIQHRQRRPGPQAGCPYAHISHVGSHFSPYQIGHIREAQDVNSEVFGSVCTMPGRPCGGCRY